MKGRPDGQPMEVELKYAVADPEALRTSLDGGTLDGIDADPWRTVDVEDRYIDTADGALESQGYGARLRRIDGHTLVTVKTDPAARRADKEDGAALKRRIEHEAPAIAQLDPSRWPESTARDLVARLAGGAKLRTRFVIRQQRLERDLRSDGSAATLSLDAAEVRLRGRAIGSFGVLEVESADGSTGLLELVAAAVEATGLVEPDTRSKELIAQELIRRARPEPDPRLPRVPKTPGIRADDTLAEAGRKVLRMHLARMLAAEAGTRSGEDPEHLHKMRVATRRMRAVWRTFDGAYRPKLQKRYVGELREVADALGAVRDMDVQLESLAAHAERLGSEAAEGLAPLRDAWSRRRDRARTALLALLDSRDYARFVDDYLAFVEEEGAGAADDSGGAPARVRDSAAGRIWQAFERVRAHDAGLRWADVPALHALRIDGKRLRYSLESFREVLPSGTNDLIAAVTAVQDHLGAINDAHVSAGMVREWLMASASGLSPDARDAAGAYLVAREQEIPRLRRTFPAVWRRVTGPTARRRLALALSEL
ncbi:MAG: CHAD domain-containing protein [Chloroflexi bacterium]|nr:CHAD domain-containing protein [Chloroflexota bacterium]